MLRNEGEAISKASDTSEMSSVFEPTLDTAIPAIRICDDDADAALHSLGFEHLDISPGELPETL